MKNKLFLAFILILSLVTLSGCTSKENSSTSSYQKITAKEAKEMMDQTEDIIILDVRSEDEFNDGHIEHALLIPDTEIEKNAESTIPDKTATILVYCRSGRRSALASASLSKLGYTNVYDFGGIIDWDYDVVTS
ncbi:MAG: rhodanese-like domain-containing protein [Velocimicrobium sp.]